MFLVQGAAATVTGSAVLTAVAANSAVVAAVQLALATAARLRWWEWLVGARILFSVPAVAAALAAGVIGLGSAPAPGSGPLLTAVGLVGVAAHRQVARIWATRLPASAVRDETVRYATVGSYASGTALLGGLATWLGLPALDTYLAIGVAGYLFSEVTSRVGPGLRLLGLLGLLQREVVRGATAGTAVAHWWRGPAVSALSDQVTLLELWQRVIGYYAARREDVAAEQVRAQLARHLPLSSPEWRGRLDDLVTLDLLQRYEYPDGPRFGPPEWLSDAMPRGPPPPLPGPLRALATPTLPSNGPQRAAMMAEARRLRDAIENGHWPDAGGALTVDTDLSHPQNNAMAAAFSNPRHNPQPYTPASYPNLPKLPAAWAQLIRVHDPVEVGMDLVQTEHQELPARVIAFARRLGPINILHPMLAELDQHYANNRLPQDWFTTLIEYEITYRVLAQPHRTTPDGRIHTRTDDATELRRTLATARATSNDPTAADMIHHTLHRRTAPTEQQSEAVEKAGPQPEIVNEDTAADTTPRRHNHDAKTLAKQFAQAHTEQTPKDATPGRSWQSPAATGGALATGRDLRDDQTSAVKTLLPVAHAWKFRPGHFLYLPKLPAAFIPLMLELDITSIAVQLAVAGYRDVTERLAAFSHLGRIYLSHEFLEEINEHIRTGRLDAKWFADLVNYEIMYRVLANIEMDGYSREEVAYWLRTELDSAREEAEDAGGVSAAAVIREKVTRLIAPRAVELTWRLSQDGLSLSEIGARLGFEPESAA
ncbi:MAG: hypothetical protein ACRDQ0_08380, partial [Pseudonocardia sp.]